MKKLLLLGLLCGVGYASDRHDSAIGIELTPLIVRGDRNDKKEDEAAGLQSSSLPQDPRLNNHTPQVSHKNMDQFKQAVAISNTVKEVIDNLGKKSLLREVTYVPFEKYAPKFSNYTNDGFEWTVQPNGTHSLISSLGTSDIAKNFQYKPHPAGFNPSAPFDQQLIDLLGIQASRIQKGTHFADDAGPEFLHPNIDANGTRILDEEGLPVRYVITRHKFFDKPAQFMTGEPVNQQAMLQEWTNLQQAFKKEKAEKATRRLKGSVWRSIWPKKFLDAQEKRDAANVMKKKSTPSEYRSVVANESAKENLLQKPSTLSDQQQPLLGKK